MLKVIKDKIYVAGKLSGSEMEYIRNLKKMGIYGGIVRKKGGIPMVPGNDFISCLIEGDLTYEDVIESSLGLLDSSDAMVLVPGWKTSPGVAQEREYAKAHRIPILGSMGALERFLKRPKILCIIGESGSGKTHVAEYIEKMYGIPMIRSHTDRKPRNPGDKDHTFHTKQSFNKFKLEDMIAYTEWEGTRYCCFHEDVGRCNTYVIDESGYSMLKTKYNEQYNVRGLRIYRDGGARKNSVGDDRVARDKGKFNLYSGDWDFEVYNDSFLSKLNRDVDKIVAHFFYYGGVPCI